MTRDDFLKHVEGFLAEMKATTTTKNKDYSVGEDDALANYRLLAQRSGVTKRVAWSCLFNKHLTAIERWVKDGFVESEGIRGRFLDAAVYCMLGAALADELESQGKDSDHVLQDVRRALNVPPGQSTTETAERVMAFIRRVFEINEFGRPSNQADALGKLCGENGFFKVCVENWLLPGVPVKMTKMGSVTITDGDRVIDVYPVPRTETMVVSADPGRTGGAS